MKLSQRCSGTQDINKITKILEDLKNHNTQITNLSASNPTTQQLIPPQEVFDLFLSESIQNYDPDPRGLLSARTALALFYHSEPDHFYITASTSEAYSWLFKLLGDPGDVFLVPKPGYPLFDFLASQELVQIVPYYLEYIHPKGWFIDFDYLNRIVKTYNPRAIVLINPNNPTGSYIRPSEYEQLITLCKTNGMSIIADEVFFYHFLDAETSFCSFIDCEEVPTFTLNGLSKLLCLPQVKLGWIHVSGSKDTKLFHALDMIADTFLSPNVFSMTALPGLLHYIPSWSKIVRQRITTNYQYAHHLCHTDTPFRIRSTQGGWSTMIEVPRILPDEELITFLLEQYYLYVQPGYFYDCKESGIIIPSLILEADKFARGLSLAIEAILNFMQ